MKKNSEAIERKPSRFPSSLPIRALRRSFPLYCGIATTARETRKKKQHEAHRTRQTPGGYRQRREGPATGDGRRDARASPNEERRRREERQVRQWQRGGTPGAWRTTQQQLREPPRKSGEQRPSLFFFLFFCLSIEFFLME